MKIEEQVLSIEQTKHLQELGVDTSDASVCWVKRNGFFDDPIQREIIINRIYLKSLIGIDNVIPTYTIGDLIEKLPKTIGIYHLMIDWNLMKIEYTNWSWQESVFREYFTLNDNPLINTLYDCLCWVVENHKELLEVKK